MHTDTKFLYLKNETAISNVQVKHALSYSKKENFNPPKKYLIFKEKPFIWLHETSGAWRLK